MHINCLELLAATLAVKTFMKNRHGSAVLLQMDNTTAVTYRIAGNFRRTLFSEISGIFRKFFYKNGALKFFKPVAKKEKITKNFKNIFPKYPLKRIFQKFRLTKISGYTVCQQLGWNDIPTTHRAGQVFMDVGAGEADKNHSPTYSRNAELNCRCRVQGNVGPVRLDVKPLDISSDITTVWSTRGQPLCILAVPSAFTLLQLEAGTYGRGNRCLQAGLEEPEELCQTTLVSGEQGPFSSTESAGQFNTSGTCVEGPTMVPSTVINAERLSSSDTQLTESLSTSHRSTHAGHSATASRVACLR